jgi:leucyl/phenylalanyl-tRNA--protein transferase
VQDMALRGPLRLVRPVIKLAGIGLLWIAVRMADPANIGWRAARVSRHPEQAAIDMDLQLGSLITPTAPDILANYTRGLLLGGRAPSCDTTFAWNNRPMRAVITRETAKVPKKLRAIQRRTELEVRYDQDFEAIIAHCQEGREGWLTPALAQVYRDVDALGCIATVATYRDGKLASGLWGIQIGRVLNIMSMFHLENNAGDLALAAIIDIVTAGGRWAIIDLVDLNTHFARYGAREIPQRQFSELIWRTLTPPPPTENPLTTGENPAGQPDATIPAALKPATASPMN